MGFTDMSRRTQIILLAAGVILTLHFYNQLFYRHLAKKTKALKKEKVELAVQPPETGTQREELNRLNELYQGRFREVSERETEVGKLEETLPSRTKMADLLAKLTSALEQSGAGFISLEPTVKKAGENEPFDSIAIDVRFYGSFEQTTKYLQAIEDMETLIGVEKIQMTLDEEAAPRPLVDIRFATFLSDRAAVKAEPLKAVEVKLPEPFHPETKPFDNRLPGDHKLSMIIWNVGKPVALIDGKVMKVGSVLDNKKLVEISADGVWFADNSVRYYLALEQ